MTFSNFFSSMLQRLATRWPVLLYATTWTAFLTATVALASFSPELAFLSAIAPSSLSSRACPAEGLVGIPLDIPTEVFCLRAESFTKSRLDMLIPPVFAAVIVASSACVVRALSLWEVDEEIH